MVLSLECHNPAMVLHINTVMVQPWSYVHSAITELWPYHQNAIAQLWSYIYTLPWSNHGLKYFNFLIFLFLKYEQPLHYLTQILLKQLDESSGNGINNNNIEVMIMKKQPISNVIDPRTTKATVRVIENFNKQFVSHHYISKIWLSDPNYHYFVDDLQNYSSFN
ncbi:hypothetical protein ES319_D10G261700v1 [Gossypium barbadense]|uniref:Uncharacterized protein n=1 Tax=Gossypium barbadense TaxID=3634 RepID=A0A5J5PW32_GOSBA|nr:hypothetical protein ES319_D10G261700v1 [Gossypium barbadense]